MTPAGRLVLFDLDGTLVDSAPGIAASVRHATRELGLPEEQRERLLAEAAGPGGDLPA